jgi:hypothetical protein
MLKKIVGGVILPSSLIIIPTYYHSEVLDYFKNKIEQNGKKNEGYKEKDIL